VDEGEALMSKKSRTLELDEDLEFQTKEWRFQRVGVAILFLFVLAAFLGFTGMGGPMSHGEAGERGGPLHVEYQRYVRRNAPASIKLHLRGEPGDVRFWVSAPYFEHVRVDSIVPTPQLVSIETNRHVYTIRTVSPDTTVTLELEHQTIGHRDAEVGIVEGPSVRFTQWAIF
jgi:hypothetical protein